jgi:hypothetical protein
VLLRRVDGCKSKTRTEGLRLFEIALVLVRFNRVASVIINRADHSAAKLAGVETVSQAWIQSGEKAWRVDELLDKYADESVTQPKEYPCSGL